MNPETARVALQALGASYRTADIRLELRDDRWLAFLPGDTLAVFPISERAVSGAHRDRAVLRAIEQRCALRAPRVLAVAPDARCDLRAMVPGVHSTHAVYDRVRNDVPNARRVGAALGAMIAEWHTRIRLADIEAELPSVPEWPRSHAWIRERLPHVIDDSALEAAADRVIARYEDSEPAGSEGDRVLVHTDVGFHNVVIDPDTLSVRGIFDWETACWSDRHIDFRHLALDADAHPLFTAAVTEYEERSGAHISRDRVFLHNAALAVTYLAFRIGHSAEERWCGRTLADDLQWTRMAIARVLGA